MSTEVKRRRGTTIEHGSFTGAIGEITIDLDKDTVVVHDGATQGGFSLLREDFSNANWLAPDGRYLLEYNNLSDITSASLLASSTRLPDFTAAMVGNRPAAPTIAAITLSTSSKADT